MKKIISKAFFILMYLIVLIFNYPGLFYGAQPQGTDSFGNIAVSNGINDKGYDSRYRHFLSFLGLTPYSNSMGASFVLSGLSLVTGITVPDTIFILESLFFVSIAFFGMFLLSRIVLSGDYQAVSCAFVLMTSRRILALTRWTYSYRGPYVCLSIVLLLVIFFLIRPQIIKKNNSKFAFLLILMLLALSSIHHMFYFNLVLFLATIIYFISVRFSKSFEVDSLLYRVFANPRFKILLITFLYLFSLIGYTFYERNTVVSDTITVSEFYDVLYLIIMSYGKSFGLLFCFVPFGLYFLMNERKKMNTFIYILLLIYSLVFFDTSYALLTLIPFLSILAVKGIYKLSDLFLNKNISPFLIGLFIILCSISPELFVFNPKAAPVGGIEHDKNKENILAMNLGHYIENQCKYSMVHQTTVIRGTSIIAYTDVNMYRAELYIPTYSYSEYWGNREISKVITGEQDTFLKDTGPEGFSLISGVMLSGETWDNEKVKLEIRKLDQYNSTLFITVTYAESPNIIVKEDGSAVESIFLQSVQDELYPIYVGEYHRVNLINYVD